MSKRTDDDSIYYDPADNVDNPPSNNYWDDHPIPASVVERWIRFYAEEACYVTWEGETKWDSDLHYAVACQWVRNKELVGEIIGSIFWDWAESMAMSDPKHQPEIEKDDFFQPDQDFINSKYYKKED